VSEMISCGGRWPGCRRRAATLPPCDISAQQRCPYRKSYLAILVMEPAQDRKADNVAGRLDARGDGASLFKDRCVRVTL
jgi:hypothetical protein